MKLQDLDVIVTAPPAPGWGGRYWILVKLTTDTGIVGWGECYASSVGPEAMTHVIRDVFERHMQGENPENIERMFRRVYSSGFTQRPDLTVMGAFSGLEIACWDILGKDRDRPVYALLGGVMNDRIRAYTYLYPLPQHDMTAFWTSPEMAAEAAADCVARGFTAVKFDPAGPYTMRGGHMPAMSDISMSVAFCKAIREAVGDKADLLFGTHGQFTTAGAIRLGQALEPYSPLWFEEPIPPDNVAEMAKVAAAVRPDHLAETQGVIGTGAQRFVHPVRTANDKGHIAPPLIAPAPQPGGKIRGCFNLSTLVQNAEKRPRRERPFQQGSLCRHAAAFLVLNLDHLRRTQPQRPPGTIEPHKVVVNQVFLGAAAQATHRTNMYAHPRSVGKDQLAWRAVSPPSIHIFSS